MIITGRQRSVRWDRSHRQASKTFLHRIPPLSPTRALREHRRHWRPARTSTPSTSAPSPPAWLPAPARARRAPELVLGRVRAARSEGRQHPLAPADVNTLDNVSAVTARPATPQAPAPAAYPSPSAVGSTLQAANGSGSGWSAQ